MIVRVEKLQSAASKILAAVDPNALAVLTETLELKTVGRNLYCSVTNREYFAQVKIPMEEEIDFHATVNANLFLKLVAQTTTETIELNISDNTLVFKGNGSYNLPLIFDGDKLLELPEITIENKTTEFNISSSILHSILQFNSKELIMGIISKPIQKLYYMDEQGAVTFTTGACVNSFTLSQPVKVLLNDRLVKLFKLFKSEDVKFILGYDDIGSGIIQTKVSFESPEIVLTAILSCDETMLASFPVNAVRGRANADYAYSVNMNREQVIQAINRLLLFSASNRGQDTRPYGVFEFGKDGVVLYDNKKANKEEILYSNTSCDLDSPYVAYLDLLDFRNVLDVCTEQYVTLNFGDSQAVVVSRGNVKNVVPECQVG